MTSNILKVNCIQNLCFNHSSSPVVRNVYSVPTLPHAPLMLVQQDSLPQAAQGGEGGQEVEAVAGQHQPDAGDILVTMEDIIFNHLVSGLCPSLSSSSGTLMAATLPEQSTSTFTMVETKL